MEQLSLEITDKDRSLIRQGLGKGISTSEIAAKIVLDETFSMSNRETRHFLASWKKRPQKRVELDRYYAELDRYYFECRVPEHISEPMREVRDLEHRKRGYKADPEEGAKVALLKPVVDETIRALRKVGLTVDQVNPIESFSDQEYEDEQKRIQEQRTKKKADLDNLAKRLPTPEILDNLVDEKIVDLKQTGIIHFSEEEVLELIQAVEIGRLRFHVLRDEAVKIVSSGIGGRILKLVGGIE